MLYLLSTLGMNFFLLTGGKTISTRLNYIEITHCFFVVIFFVPSVMEHIILGSSNMVQNSSKQKGDSRRNLQLIYLHDRLFVFMILGWMFRKKSCRDFTYTSKQIYFSCHHSSMEVYLWYIQLYKVLHYRCYQKNHPTKKPDVLFFTLLFLVKSLIIPACSRTCQNFALLAT